MWFVLLGRGEPERVATGVVSCELLRSFGVQAGRRAARSASDDDAHGADAVLVLSHAYWKSRFGGDPNVVGQVFEMNDRPHTVIGVLPPIPQFPDENDVYMPVVGVPLPIVARASAPTATRGMVQAFGRLRPGATRGGALSDLAMVASNLQQAYPDELSGERRVHGDRRVAARRADARVPADAGDPLGAGGLPAAHRLRERGQPDARAAAQARARDGDPDVAWRRPLAPACGSS